MLYLIDKDYYMLRNREYVKVDLELKNNELSIKPNRNEVIEVNDNIKAKGVLIDNIIKELKSKQNSPSYERNKFDR